MTSTKKSVQCKVDATALAVAIQLQNRNQVLAGKTDDMVEAFTAF